MNIHDPTYLQLLYKVLYEGTPSDDRTGTGTLSIFSGRMEFDLRETFPLLTSKKVHWPSVVWELLWMIRGETNVKWLNERGVTIWNEWSDQNGELGPVYGEAWRNFGGKIRRVPQPKPTPVGNYCGVGDGQGSEGHPLKKRWQGMLQRCYRPTDIDYKDYGGRGVSVCDRWLTFTHFAEDAVKLPGYRSDRLEDLYLDKDILGDGLRYSPSTCQWVTPSENTAATSTMVYTVEKEGIQYQFSNITEFCCQHGAEPKNFSDLWSGAKNAKVRSGFRLVSVRDTSLGVDQLKEVIERIEINPNDRRLVVSAWNPVAIPYSALPPCHMFYQFYVRNGELSCQMYQRSADMFLGVPFNIASYALLTHIIAHLTGLKPGKFIWVGGDCHIYSNHIEQVRTQIERRHTNLPPSPTLTIKPNAPTDIDGDWHLDHFDLQGYNPLPAIKAPVAV